MASIGVDRRTGRLLRDWDHVAQSIGDIVTTRVLSRLMRREYGGEAPKLIDEPMSERTLLEFYRTIAEALEDWEPRFELTRVSLVEASAGGNSTLQLSGVYYPRGHLGDRTAQTASERTVELMELSETRWR